MDAQNWLVKKAILNLKNSEMGKMNYLKKLVKGKEMDPEKSPAG